MPIEVREAPRRPGDPPMLVAAGARIRNELGWEPHKPQLQEMIGDAWSFAQARPDGLLRLSRRRGQRVGEDLLALLRGVDDGDAVGVSGGQLVVGGRDPGEELVGLALQPVGLGRSDRGRAPVPVRAPGAAARSGRGSDRRWRRR